MFVVVHEYVGDILCHRAESATSQKLIYNPAYQAGTDSGYSLQAVFNRMPCQQFTPLYMFLYAYVAVLAIFGTAVVVLFPALNVHDMFTSFYDWVSRMKFFFAIITNLPCYSRVASELCIIFHFE